MKVFFVLGFLALISTGCQNNEGNGAQPQCSVQAAVNTATLAFDGSALNGRQIQLKSGGRLVWDSCNPSTAFSGDYHVVDLNGAGSEIVHYLPGPSFPTNESLELLSSPDCSSTWTSRGTASVTYAFKQESGEGLCGATYSHDEQPITFR